MNKSKEEWRLKLSSLLQDGDISGKHPRIEKKIWDCVLDAIESEAVKRENFAFNKGRTTHSQNKEAEIRMDERESIKRKLTSLPMMNNETPEKRATTYWLNVEHVMEALTPPPESPEVLKD